MSTRNNSVKYWPLAMSDRGLFFRAMWLLFVTSTGLGLVSFRRIQSLIGPVNLDVCNALQPIKAAAEARQTAQIVVAAAPHGRYGVRCLATSLVCRYFLLHQSIQAHLRLGV